ncbi:MAG: 5-formyltetrahydrofolate cyclo-ligase [Nitrospirae bacterium]|nr:5-formyltetrahydrofolate cyclo-ligase [Nitrospirota bacterium]
MKTVSKDAMRRDALSRRDAIPAEEKSAKDALIARNLVELDEYRDAGLILFYVSFRSEAATLELVMRTVADGKRVAVPKVFRAERMLRFYPIDSPDELQPGYLGIPEPKADSAGEIDPADADMIVMPGAAFDRLGNRIGYGGGYYDKVIAALGRPMPTLVALAYDEQIFDAVPAEPHDQRVDMVVTESEVIRCR